MDDATDQLYELLPAVYRLRDADRGYPLRALLRVIGEQVDVVKADIDGLYDDWFIETCADWVVPYIADLVGYTAVHEAGEPGDGRDAEGRTRNRILVPRREVANTIRFRRRKGTLAVLEDVAAAVAGWPAHAVESYRLLAVAQHLNHLRLDRGRTIDVRAGEALERIDGPFDAAAHTVDVRGIASHRGVGRYDIPNVGVFVWRLKSYPITQTPAFCLEEEASHCYLFSVLGNDTPLYTRPATRRQGGRRTADTDFPAPIRRRRLADATGLRDFYGRDASFEISVGVAGSPRRPFAPEDILVADLSAWTYAVPPGKVAVDPERGRILFPPGQPRKQGVWVSYSYGFGDDIGGGEYDRRLEQPSDAVVYRVGEGETYARINDALARWQTDAPAHAVIEITDGGVYVEQVNVSLRKKQSLQLRAANRTRPVLRLLDWQTSQPDDLSITGERDTWFTLDGVLVTGRGVQVDGDVSGVVIRHSTLVPGWGLHCDCEPRRGTEPSLELRDAPACVTIDHSIVGAIQVVRAESQHTPIAIRVRDSIVDATRPSHAAIGGGDDRHAHATLTVVRSTIFGAVRTHAIAQAENTIFTGTVRVARRQLGCVRFCWVPPSSRTPRRHACQPDLVDEAVDAAVRRGGMTTDERDALRDRERLRVEPDFASRRYGTPTYARLADTCAEEITRGADDESEMGVFHDLFQPQRAANLRARLDEHAPAGLRAAVVFAT